MNAEDVSNWKKYTDSLLIDCKKFMECNKKFGRGFIGELLVFQTLLRTYSDELLKNGNEIKYFGASNPDYDILLKLGNREFKINAKETNVLDTNKNPKWIRQKASKFVVNPNSSDATVRIDGDKNLFYVYVNVTTWKDNDFVQFFVISEPDAMNVFGNNYINSRKRKDFAARKNNSDDMWVLYENIKQYEDKNLDLFKKILILKKWN